MQLSFFLTIFCCALSIPLHSQTVDSLDRPALQVHGAEHSVLLDVVKTGNRIVAVGERGVVTFSDDGGRTWRQASVPTSVSLTKVYFATPKAGWIVGHSGAVLHTADGGETWTRQLDGITAAKLAVEAAQLNADHAGASNAVAQRAPGGITAKGARHFYFQQVCGRAGNKSSFNARRQLQSCSYRF